MHKLLHDQSLKNEKTAVVGHLFAFFPAISAENDPGFFAHFLKNNIFGKNSDRSATIFYRADASHLEPTWPARTSETSDEDPDKKKEVHE